MACFNREIDDIDRAEDALGMSGTALRPTLDAKAGLTLQNSR